MLYSTDQIAIDKIKFISKLTNCVRSISRAISIAIFVTAIGSCSTSRQAHTVESSPVKLNDSLLTDRDGNRYRIKILPDGNLWMTANLKLNIPGSFCYENAAENCEQYGRLYTWESAQQGCSLLGDGWRLPAKDEWQRLAELYGPVTNDSVETRKKAYFPLLYTGNSQFNAVLGGGRDPDGHYTRKEAHGFYWTATSFDSSTAGFANFAKGSQSLYLQNDGEKPGAFSVRCVKSINSLK
jgi:uncharacterized protein (TIGR02145 family)